MTAEQLLADLQGQGIQLHADGSRLRWKAPAGLVTPDLTAQLQAHKPALLRMLSGRMSPIGDTPVDVRNCAQEPDSEINQRRSFYLYAKRKGFPTITTAGMTFTAGKPSWRSFSQQGAQLDLWAAALALDDVPEVPL